MIISSFHIITLYFIQTNPMFYSSEDFFSNIYLSFTPNVCIFLAFFSCLCFCWDSRPALNRRPENSESDTGTPAKEPQSNRSDIPKKRQQRNQNRRKRNCGGMYMCVCVVCICVHANKKGLENKQQHKHKRRQKPAQRERERESSQKERETEITAGGGNRTVLTNKQNKHNNCWQTSKHTQTEATRNIHFSPGRME